MGRNFNYASRRERLREVRCQNLRNLRTRVRRADDGKVLGVFKGIADSMGWSVCLTRWLGVIALLGLSGIFGVEGFKATLLAWGFFYLLAAALMGPTRPAPDLQGEGSPAGPFGVDWRSADQRPSPPPVPRTSAASSSASFQGYRPRVDLAALDRQLESLNRRIRRMESVVTDPGYDWERRLGK